LRSARSISRTLTGRSADMAHWLQIREDGTIALDPRAAGGLWAEPVGLVLAGDLSAFDFSDLLSLVVHVRMSGVLRICTPGGDRSLSFEDGELRGVMSTRVGERLSEVLVRMGLLKPEQMEALVVGTTAGQRVGRVAVERGLIDERDLWNAIQEQVTSIFQAIQVAEEGAFTFTDRPLEGGSTVPGLSVEMLLMEGLRRIDEMKAASPADARSKLEHILSTYNAAFRCVFEAFRSASTSDALERASRSAFSSDAFRAAFFDGIEFTAEGEVPVATFLERFEDVARGVGDDPQALLHDVVRRGLLFLLFVTGEHLDGEVQQELYERVKAMTALSAG
jgi:hypothetical protein